MAVTDFTDNLTALGTSVITIAGDAGALFMKEPYIYIICVGVAAGAILMAGSFILKRRGGKGRR